MLLGRSAFLNFAERYTAEGDTRLSVATKGKKRVAKGFAVDDTMLNDFRSYLASEKIKIDDEAFKKDLEFIKAEIHYEIDVALFGVSEAQKNLIAHDPQAQYAEAQFADAVKLTELAKNHAGAKGH
jgi:carboxyl-terminal processing protease